jgi:hypothetical protein
MTIRMMMKAKNAIYEFTQIRPWLFLLLAPFHKQPQSLGSFILSALLPRFFYFRAQQHHHRQQPSCSS